jgi:cysteinyl-tRNA synthetase
LGEAPEAAKTAVNEHLSGSFKTPGAMAAISDLVTKFNSADKATVNPEHVEQMGKWVTSMVNIFGLNGPASPDASEIGWSGIDVPEEAKPYLYSLSALRDSLRERALSKEGISAEDIKNIVGSQAESETAVSESAKP